MVRIRRGVFNLFCLYYTGRRGRKVNCRARQEKPTWAVGLNMNLWIVCQSDRLSFTLLLLKRHDLRITQATASER